MQLKLWGRWGMDTPLLADSVVSMPHPTSPQCLIVIKSRGADPPAGEGEERHHNEAAPPPPQPTIGTDPPKVLGCM